MFHVYSTLGITLTLPPRSLRLLCHQGLQLVGSGLARATRSRSSCRARSGSTPQGTTSTACRRFGRTATPPSRSASRAPSCCRATMPFRGDSWASRRCRPRSSPLRSRQWTCRGWRRSLPKSSLSTTTARRCCSWAAPYGRRCTRLFASLVMYYPERVEAGEMIAVAALMRDCYASDYAVGTINGCAHVTFVSAKGL